MSFVFALVTLIAMPPWLLMILLPRATVTRQLATSTGWILALAGAYVLLFVPAARLLLPVLLYPNLQAVSGALSWPLGATLAWVHFLAFDLFVGRWIFLDALDRGLLGWRSSLTLVLTLLLGPLGFLAWMALRARAADRTGWVERRRR